MELKKLILTISLMLTKKKKKKKKNSIDNESIEFN